MYSSYKWKNSPNHANKVNLKLYDLKVKGIIKGARKRYMKCKLDPRLNSKELWKNINDEGFKENDVNDCSDLFDVNQLNIAFVSSFPSNMTSCIDDRSSNLNNFTAQLIV